MKLTYGKVRPDCRSGIHVEFWPKGSTGGYVWGVYFPKPTVDGHWTVHEFIDFKSLMMPARYAFGTLYLWGIYIGLSLKPRKSAVRN